jgi:hypothetical protein
VGFEFGAGFNPGDFDLNKSFTEYKFDVPSFGTGVDAGGGFAGSSGVAGKFKGLFDGLFGGDDDTFGKR